MAKLADRLPGNALGDLFVDASCVNCAVCRWVAPATFSDGGGISYVARQPRDPGERHRAAMALVACPTSSIGTVSKTDLTAAVAALPERIEDEVWFCGFTSPDSFGAASYLIRRPAGNVLVDSPRAAGPLVSRLEELGGVCLMVLTHRDDVADHAVFAQRFGCERVLHADDVTASTRGVERKVQGIDPVRLADDLLFIPTLGHTRGHAALLFRDRYLFTGDHLSWSPANGRLRASRATCWHSWKDQARSMERLVRHRFVWILPGHGHRWKADSEAAMRDAVARCAEAMHREELTA